MADESSGDRAPYSSDSGSGNSRRSSSPTVFPMGEKVNNRSVHALVKWGVHFVQYPSGDDKTDKNRLCAKPGVGVKSVMKMRMYRRAQRKSLLSPSLAT